jgi:hypothetical protein
LITTPDASLNAIRLKLMDGHPQGDAGFAAVTVGPIGKDAAATKAYLHKIAVDR